jgi:hypothetical protein
MFGMCTSTIFSNLQQPSARLKHSHGSGDPDCLEGALQEAQDHGLDEEHLVPAQVAKRHATAMLLLLAFR